QRRTEKTGSTACLRRQSEPAVAPTEPNHSSADVRSPELAGLGSNDVFATKALASPSQPECDDNRDADCREECGRSGRRQRSGDAAPVLRRTLAVDHLPFG